MKWESVELGEVCEIKGGYAFKSKNFRKSGIPIIRISNISHNEVNVIEGTPCAPLEDLDKYHSFKIYKNDVLIALSGATTGKYGIYKHNTPALLNQRVGLIKSKDESVLNTKYFFFYLEKLKEEVLRKASGVAQPNISTKEISKLKIPLPPLPEQRRLAARLDKADALRQKSRAVVETYAELGRSVFLEVFGDPVRNERGWEVVELEDVLEKIQIGPFGSQLHKSDYIDNGVPLINPKHINNLSVEPEMSVSITTKKYNNLPQYHLNQNDVIMARRGEMGRCARIGESGKFFCGTGSLYIRPSSNLIDSVYLTYFLSSNSIVEYLENNAQGVTMKNLNKSMVSAIPTPLPPLPLQTHFAGMVANIEAQRRLAERQLDAAEAVFGGVLQGSFEM